MQPIMTTCGPLIPQHTANDLRRKEILPVTEYPDGTVKSLPLEQQTVVPTPAGDLPAELLTFHPDGSLSRIFPLNGKLSGYWGQEDEAELAKPLTIPTPVGEITARILGLAFYPGGALRSITLWPEDDLEIPTPAGTVRTRIGMSFYEDGTLHSVEPAMPTPVDTPAGTIQAIDPDAVGVNADANSLAFDREGRVTDITTTLTSLELTAEDGTEERFAPRYRDSLCGDTEKEVDPMRITFEEDRIVLRFDVALPGKPVSTVGKSLAARPFFAQLSAFGGMPGQGQCSGAPTGF